MLKSICGIFTSNPLAQKLVVFPLQLVFHRTGKPHVVVDLSFPSGSSVNDGILKDTYSSVPFALRLPGTDAFVKLIRQSDPGFHLFKKDLSRAYRQLHIDTCDYHLLRLQYDNLL